MKLQVSARHLHCILERWRKLFWKIFIGYSFKYMITHSSDELFLSYRPFWEKCTKWPQNDLEHCKLKRTTYVCVTSVLDSQILIRFALRPAVFEIQASLGQVHQMTPKWHWTLQGQRYPIYVLLLSTSSKVHSISLYGQPFWRYRQLWEKCTEWPQNDLERYKVKGTPYMC